MNELDNLSKYLDQGTDDLNLGLVLVNFFLAILISFLVRAFYINYSISLTGKMHIGSILPILTAVVFLVIIVVKSSLALSLGLVGALSIVRFRTPIKEPEELVYLFLAIAIGLGFGAGYSLITGLLTVLTLGIVYFTLSNKKTKNLEYNLVVSWKSKNLVYKEILNNINGYASNLKLVRYEYDDSTSNSIFLIELSENSNIDKLSKKLKDLDKSISITFYESKMNW